MVHTEDPGHAISIGLAGGFAQICAMRRRVKRTVGHYRHCARRLRHAWTHPFSTRSWDHYMKPDTQRQIERTWGWGYVVAVKADTSLYGRRTAGAAGEKIAQKVLPGIWPESCESIDRRTWARETCHRPARQPEQSAESGSRSERALRPDLRDSGPDQRRWTLQRQIRCGDGRESKYRRQASRVSAAPRSRQQLDSRCTFLPRAGLIEWNR